MPNATYNIRIDKQIREEADALYKSMGLSLSAAINLFLTQSVIQGKLPLGEVIAERPAGSKVVVKDFDVLNVISDTEEPESFDPVDKVFE